MAAKNTISEKIETLTKRIIKLEYTIGINEDGTRNGNGLIKKIDELKDNVNSLSTTLNNYSKSFESSINKIDILFEKLDRAVEERKMIINTLDNTKKELEQNNNEIKNIKEELKGNITVESLHKFQKVIVGIAGLIGALSTIIFTINYFSK